MWPQAKATLRLVIRRPRGFRRCAPAPAAATTRARSLQRFHATAVVANTRPAFVPSSSFSSSSDTTAAAAACAFALAVTVGLAGDSAHAAPAVTSSSSSSSSSTAQPSASQRFLSPDFISDAVSQTAPALVNLTVEVSGGWGGALGQSTGSGFIITEDGYVVTNNHVVAAGGTSAGNSVTVTMSNGRKYRGRVHSTDKMSDLALVKIEPRRRGERFPVMRLGTSCNLKPGQWVVALGSPLTLQNTVTAGIISSVARHSSEIGMSNNRNEYIQTDAAINVGNSGGPLINISGEVIGINTMKTAQGAGIGFAIPMDSAWQVIKQLRAHRKVVRPYIGMRMVTLDPKIVADERMQNPNFPPVDSGVMVTAVAPGSPSQAAGIEPGDCVLSFDGKPVRDTRDILNRLGVEVGKRIEMRVLRDGDEKRLVVVTGQAA
jgi:HtrA serine peptidase 2